MGTYVVNSKKEQQELLTRCGLNSFVDLYKDIPEEVLLKDGLNLPKGLAELEVKRKFEDLADKNKLDLLKSKIKLVDIDKLATKLNAGVFTVKDILDALTKPGRDPREDLPAPLTRQNIIKLEDIKVGTIMRGTVRNITDFGVFVDIGIKTAGLIHISELSNKHVKHPLDVVSVGDILNVLVISVDAKRNRIGLSLKQVTKENNNVLA